MKTYICFLKDSDSSRTAGVIEFVNFDLLESGEVEFYSEIDKGLYEQYLKKFEEELYEFKN